MEQEHPVSIVGIDRFTAARQYDYHLSTTAPIYANSNTYPQETPFEIDVHEGTEVGILLTGGQERQTGDTVQQLVRGDVWLSAAWEQHAWRVSQPDTRDVVLIFLPEFLGDERLNGLPWLTLFAAPPKQRPRVTTEAMRERVFALGSGMLREIEEGRPGWQSALRLDLLRTLLTLSREWEPPQQSEVQSRLRASDLQRILPALVLVHSRPARRVTVEEAAEACGLGRARFSALFRGTMGLSFGKFCLRSRLGFAARLLLSTDSSIQAVAEHTGFADASHLHRAFVKQYACTPGFYRTRPRRGQRSIPPVGRARSIGPSPAALDRS